ncbi:MAG: hypothetical protein ACRDAM_22670 [Casimicrobium sp.]
MNTINTLLLSFAQYWTRVKRQGSVVALLSVSALVTPLSHAQVPNITVVEYYHRGLDAYFISGRADEQAFLDTLPNIIGRTGATFAAFAPNGAPPTATSVCRFYVSIANPFVSSHFYSRLDQDCAFLRNPLPAGFNDEGLDFATFAPNATGSCDASAPIAIYRSFRAAANGRTPNHRYTTSRAQYDAMNSSGWTPEGIAFCTTAANTPGATNTVAFRRTVTPTQSPFSAGCDGVASPGATLNRGAEVEPHIARNSANEDHLLASWQQDRWSNGGAAALGGAVSFDGGKNWASTPAPFSRCAGGNAANGGDYDRATDPWSAIGNDGTAYQMALAFSGDTFAANSVSAMIVARSTDGGRNWQTPVTLVRDASPSVFHDKNMMIVDPIDLRFAYAVWGRLSPDGSGPAWFSRTTDRGATWETSRGIYDPGARNQTFGNNLAMASDGTLVNVFLEIRRNERLEIVGGQMKMVRSTDRGVTWSTPIVIAEYLGIGARDPETNIAIRDGVGLPSIASGTNNSLHMVWQDARFGGGTRDGIVYVRSNDAGLTWSQPRLVNARADVQAFTPIVNVRGDGVIGVAYYDLRANSASTATLGTVLRMATSTDGITWHESEAEPEFNLNTAPFARGHFLGDYFGLTSRKGAFETFHMRTTGSAPDNRTEGIFASLPEGTLKRRSIANAHDTLIATPVNREFSERVNEALNRAVAARRIGGNR